MGIYTGGAERGFTLIELSIVLVIIGLLVGGVVVGQDLIRAAGVRAQVTQIEKFKTAANTFREKYGYLPGDIKDPDASNFGFAARGNYKGQGDGNGIIEGNYLDNSSANLGIAEGAGETVMFWSDLSKARLIDGSFSTASSTVSPGADITGSQIGLYLPEAKVGYSNFIYVFSPIYGASGIYVPVAQDWFGLSGVTSIPVVSNSARTVSNSNLPVSVAYAIDKKIDDSLPQSGSVQTWYVNGSIYWQDGTDADHFANEPLPYTGALAGSKTTCYDNNNVAGAMTTYSMSQNAGAGTNCALSFRFQ